MISALEIARVLHQPPPTEEQVEIIESPLSALLVVAGAGSGKTQTMAARAVYLVANGLVDASQILGLTFTRKAAFELSERISANLRRLREAGIKVVSPPEDVVAEAGAGAFQMESSAEVSTYNSFAAALVADYGLEIGVNPESTLLTEAGAHQVMSDIVAGWQSKLHTPYSAATVTRRALSLAGELSEHLVSESELEEFDRHWQGFLQDPGQPSKTGPAVITKRAIEIAGQRLEFLKFVRAYRDFKRENTLLDYSDQVALAVRIVESSARVVKDIRRRYRAVLLDEFQDTSVAQLRLFSALFSGTAVTAVGDPNQAIYGWRGASQSSLQNFGREFGSNRVATLSTAWRNNSSILEVANLVAAPLRHYARENGQVESPRLQARRGAGAGEVLQTVAADEDTEAQRIARYLAENWTELGSCAVLCRRKADFERFAQALQSHNLPVEVIDLSGLLSQPQVSLLRAALEVAVDPGRGDFLMELLLFLQLGPRDLALMWKWAGFLARERSRGGPGDGDDYPVISLLSEAVDYPPSVGWGADDRGEKAGFSAAAHHRITWLGKVLSELRAACSLPVPDLVIRGIQALELDVEVGADPGGGPAEAALQTFVSAARDYRQSGLNATARGFLDWLASQETAESGMQMGPVQPRAGAVQILTVHAAKGLEWDTVVVPSLRQDIFPSTRVSPWTTAEKLPYPLRGDASALPELQFDQPLTHRLLKQQLEEFRQDCLDHQVREERRLFYVAVTRARQRLILTSSWPVRLASGRQKPQLSEFFTELQKADLVQNLPLPVSENPLVEWAEIEVSDPLDNSSEEVIWPSSHTPNWRVEAVAGVVAAQRSLAQGTVLPEPTDSDLKALELMAQALLKQDSEPARKDWELTVPASLAPTKLTLLSEDVSEFAKQTLRPLPTAPSDAANLGTVFHAWVEQQLRRSMRGESVVDLSLPQGLSPAQLQRLHRWQNNWKKMDWLGQYSVVEVEAERTRVVRGVRIPARIDAVFRGLHDGVTTIVDWKTGVNPLRSKDSRLRQRVALQLQIYRLVWALESGDDTGDIRVLACYVDEGEVVDLETLAGGGEFGEKQLLELVASFPVDSNWEPS